MKRGHAGEGGGKPKKLSHELLERLEDLLADDAKVVMHTDNDLLLLLNQGLEPKHQISKRTLEKWKTGEFGKWNGMQPNLWGMTEADFYARFVRLIELALLRMKEQIFAKITAEDVYEERESEETGVISSVLVSKAPDWKKWAWILERKFAEWNLKSVSEVDMNARIISLAAELEAVNTPAHAGS